MEFARVFGVINLERKIYFLSRKLERAHDLILKRMETIIARSSGFGNRKSSDR
jgi:hypothetical protein